MNRKYFSVMSAGLGIFLALTGAACTPVSRPASGKIQVVTSFYPLYFFANQIAGDKAEVANITPAGAEPHDYEPTAQDIARIADSQLLILNGGGLEAWGENIKRQLDTKKTVLVAAGEGLATQSITEDGHRGTDLHVWLSPPIAEKMVDAILQGFIQADPRYADTYRLNAEILKSQLATLDAEYAAGLNDCVKKDFITSHAAFGYLATAYHLNQVSIAGLLPDAEPSPQQLATLASFAREHRVEYIFFESLVSPKLAETLAHEVGAKTLLLNPLEGLSDNELAAGKDYFSEMRANLVNLQTALQCTK